MKLPRKRNNKGLVLNSRSTGVTRPFGSKGADVIDTTCWPISVNEPYFKAPGITLRGTRHHASINSSGAHPPRATAGHLLTLLVPGGGAILSRLRGLDISIPRGEPRAFDTRVLEINGKEEAFVKDWYVFSILDISSFLVSTGYKYKWWTILTIPVNSPGFPGSLQVFHEISRSPG